MDRDAALAKLWEYFDLLDTPTHARLKSVVLLDQLLAQDDGDQGLSLLWSVFDREVEARR